METWSPVARRSFEKRFVTALNFVKSRTAPILLCGLDDGSLCAVQFLSGSIDPVELTSKCSLGPVLSMSLIDLQGNGVDCFINCKEEEDDESEKDTPAADISYVFVLCTHERGYDIVCLTLGADSAISVNDSCKSSKTKDGVLTSAIVSVDDINKCFCLLDNRMNIVGYDLFKCKKIFSDSLSTQKLPSLFCDSEKASDKDERSGSNSKDGYESTRNENSQENSIGEFCMCSNGQLFQVQKSFGKGLFIHSVLRGAEEHELHMCDSALLGDQKSKPSFFGKLFSGDIPVGRHLDEFFVPPKEKPRKSSSSSSSSSSSPSSRPPQSGATLRGDYANSPEDDQMSTLGALSESMDLLMKNQEKLNVIADKSNDLANNAEVFMKACEELAKNMK